MSSVRNKILKICIIKHSTGCHSSALNAWSIHANRSLMHAFYHYNGHTQNFNWKTKRMTSFDFEIQSTESKIKLPTNLDFVSQSRDQYA